MEVRLLIVEDDDYKAEDLMKEIGENYAVSVAASVRDAVVQVLNEDFMIIILDMALPTFTASASSASGTAQAQGGMEILRAVKAKRCDAKIIIVSQYPDFEIDGVFQSLNDSPKFLSQRYGVAVVGAVIYDFQNRAWANDLKALLKSL